MTMQNETIKLIDDNFIPKSKVSQIEREARISELNRLITRIPVDEFGDQKYILNLNAYQILERIKELEDKS